MIDRSPKPELGLFFIINKQLTTCPTSHEVIVYAKYMFLYLKDISNTSDTWHNGLLLYFRVCIMKFILNAHVDKNVFRLSKYIKITVIKIQFIRKIKSLQTKNMVQFVFFF